MGRQDVQLLPVPTNHPKDPLRWPRWLKISMILTTSMTNFVANMAGAGPAVAEQVFVKQFHKSQEGVTQLLTFNFLFLGIGNIFWVPVAVKLGKRAALLISMALQLGALIWCAVAESFGSLLAARIVLGFASASGESIVPEVVSDLFFLHERAGMMSIYVIMIAGGTAVGPLIAGFMVEYTSDTWRSYFWLCAALAAVNVLMLFFFCPECNFNRPVVEQVTDSISLEPIRANGDSDKDKDGYSLTELLSNGEYPTRTPLLKDRLALIRYDRNISFLGTLIKPLILLRHLSVIWGIFIYGCALSPQIILIFTMDSLLSSPPYSFSSSIIGLMQIAAMIGFVIACFGGGYLSDSITAQIIRRSNGEIRPEQRLISLIPGMLIAPAGCILLAFACQQKLHWIAIAFGFGMVSFGEVFTPNIALTYIVHRHQKDAAQCLVLINIFKNLVAFTFLYAAVPWVKSQGYLKVYMIMFMLNMLALLLAVPLYMNRRKGWTAI